MASDHTIAFIGAGNMAGALIRGLVKTETVPATNITASDPDDQRLANLASELGIDTTSNNVEAVRGSRVVVLATKPGLFALVLPELADALEDGTLVVSVAAGISTAIIERTLGPRARVVRTMPNTPALVGSGVTAIAGGSNATDADVDLVSTLLSSVGLCVRVPEDQLDAVTGLSGSGPAYVFALVEALRDAGVREGLSPDTALTLASQTVLGAARLLCEGSESPESLREKVTSPGGTTRAGLDALQAAGFQDALIGAVRAATRRSGELRAIAESAHTE